MYCLIHRYLFDYSSYNRCFGKKKNKYNKETERSESKYDTFDFPWHALEKGGERESETVS